MLRDWAAQLCELPSAPEAVVALHVADAVVAFLAGARTREGRALLALYSDQPGAGRVGAMAGIIRLTECDDIHLGACVTPGAIVVPVALACAPPGAGRAAAVLRAVTAGTAAGLRLGRAIGGAGVLAHGLWPSLFVAPLMAAVTAAVARGEDAERLAHAMALALAGTAARLGRPSGPRTGRWFLMAEAVSGGLRAADAAGQGFAGDVALLSQDWLAAMAVPALLDLACLLPTTASPGIAEVGFKPFAAARQAVNAVLAFQTLLETIEHPDRIEAVEVSVPAMNLGLIGRPAVAGDRLGQLSNLGLLLAAAAFSPGLLYDIERRAPPTAAMLALAARVSVQPAADLDAAYPGRWGARLVVRLTDGRMLENSLTRMPLDADAPDLAEQLQQKWRRLLPPADLHRIPQRADADLASLWRDAEGWSEDVPEHPDAS